MLERLFAEAADTHIAPPEALTARVLDDGMRERPIAGGKAVQKEHGDFDVAVLHKGRLAGLLGAIGGIPGAGGLVTAGILGLWIGVSPPDMLQVNASGLWDIFNVDLTSSWASYGDIL